MAVEFSNDGHAVDLGNQVESSLTLYVPPNARWARIESRHPLTKLWVRVLVEGPIREPIKFQPVDLGGFEVTPQTFIEVVFEPKLTDRDAVSISFGTTPP